MYTVILALIVLQAIATQWRVGGIIYGSSLVSICQAFLIIYLITRHKASFKYFA